MSRYRDPYYGKTGPQEAQANSVRPSHGGFCPPSDGDCDYVRKEECNSPMMTRESASSVLENMIRETESKLQGLIKLKKVADLASDDRDLEHLLWKLLVGIQ